MRSRPAARSTAFVVALSGCLALLSACGGASGPRNLTPEKAGAMAGDYLAGQNLDWGQPTRYTPVKDGYWFYYPTPEAERAAMGGDRVLIIKEDGSVSPYPRQSLDPTPPMTGGTRDSIAGRNLSGNPTTAPSVDAPKPVPTVVPE